MFHFPSLVVALAILARQGQYGACVGIENPNTVAVSAIHNLTTTRDLGYNVPTVPDQVRLSLFHRSCSARRVL